MSSFKSILQEFIGQDRGVYIPKTFIKMTGEMGAAALLAQIIYWSQRTANPDGWFWKSAKEWDDELGISTFQINRYMKTLKQFGVETKLKKAKGAPTLHYRLNWEQLELVFNQYLENADGDWISKFLENRENDKSIYIDNNNSNGDQIPESDSHRVQLSDKSDEVVQSKKNHDVKKEKRRHWTIEVIALECFSLQRDQIKQSAGRIAIIVNGSHKGDGEMGLLQYAYGVEKVTHETITEEQDLKLSQELILMFAWWRKTKPGISVPKVAYKIWSALQDYRKSHQPHVTTITPLGNGNTLRDGIAYDATGKIIPPVLPPRLPPIVTKKEPEYDF